jgi:hypothetical protein
MVLCVTEALIGGAVAHLEEVTQRIGWNTGGEHAK